MQPLTQRVPAPDLAAELIHKILDDVGDDQRTLLSVAFLSRQWRDCSRPRLLRDVTFKDIEALLGFAKLYNSKHASLPKTYRNVVLHLKDRPYVLGGLSDRLIIYSTLLSISAEDKLGIFAGKKTIPPWILGPIRNWASIRQLHVVGGRHPAPQFFEYLESLPNLGHLLLEGPRFVDAKRVGSPQRYSFPPTIKTLHLLRTRNGCARFLREKVIESGGFTNVKTLVVCTETKFVRSEEHAWSDELSEAFKASRLSHLERLAVYQMPCHDTDSLRSAMSIVATLALHHVDRLEQLTLNYMAVNMLVVEAVLSRHVLLAISSARNLKSLQLHVPVYIKDHVDSLKTFMWLLDQAIAMYYHVREEYGNLVVASDAEDSHPFEICIQGIAWEITVIADLVNSLDSVMRHATEKHHKIKFLPE